MQQISILIGDGGILNMWKAELESQMILTNWRDHLKEIGFSSIRTNANYYPEIINCTNTW